MNNNFNELQRKKLKISDLEGFECELRIILRENTTRENPMNVTYIVETKNKENENEKERGQ